MTDTRIHELLTMALQVLEETKAHVLFSVSESGCHINIMDKGFALDFNSDYDGMYHFNQQTADYEKEYQRCADHLKRLLLIGSCENKDISEKCISYCV